MSNITKFIEVLTAKHKEQMEEQERHHKDQMAEKTSQSREQEKKHAEQMAVLIKQVKVKDTEMKRLIEVAHDGAKKVPQQWPASSHSILTQSCGWITWKDSGLPSQQTPFLK